MTLRAPAMATAAAALHSASAAAHGARLKTVCSAILRSCFDGCGVQPPFCSAALASLVLAPETKPSLIMCRKSCERKDASEFGALRASFGGGGTRQRRCCV